MSGFFHNYGDKTAAIEEDGTSVTYSFLFEKAEELAKSIGNRTLIFSLCTNSIGSLTGYVACENYGIVPLLLADNLDQDLLYDLIESYHPEYIWLPEKKRKLFPNYQEVYHSLGYVLLETCLVPYPMYSELALLLTTSGSTGSPKLVKQSYKNIKSNTESIVEYLQLNDTERPITSLPMNYTYGLSIVNTHLYVGATLLLTDKTLMQKEFWNFFKSKKATSLAGVPYTYEMLKKLRFFQMELPSLRYMTQAGGKLSPELHKQFAEYAAVQGKRFIVMYGQTEATARMAYLPADKALEKYGSMGIAIPGGKFCLLDSHDKEIEEPDVVGELVYYGDNVTLGYAENGYGLINGDERNGRLATGDMAKRDADGFYYIVGRKKRFLKIFGNRVNLDEMERLLKREFDGMECACSGKDDNLIVYIVKTKEKNVIDKDTLRKFISLKTGINSSAFQIKMITGIPQNDAGKTLYSKLEEAVCD